MKPNILYLIIATMFASLGASCSRSDNTALKDTPTSIATKEEQRPYRTEVMGNGWVNRYRADMFTKEVPSPMYGIVLSLRATASQVTVRISATNATLRFANGQSAALSIFQHISATNATPSVHSPWGVKRDIEPSRAFLGTLATELPYVLSQYHGLVWSIGRLPESNKGFDFPAWGLGEPRSVEYAIQPQGVVQFGLIFQADTTNAPIGLNFQGQDIVLPK